MTLIELPDLVQGTDAWHDQRRGLVTASVVGKLITASTHRVARNDESRGLTAMLVAERITGRTDPIYINADMQRGHDIEPIARDLYSERYAPVRETGFMVLEETGLRLGYSPDGLVGDDGLIEVKAPRAKKHLLTVLSDRVPPEHMPQIQAGLLVSGRDWLDFISYHGGMPMWVQRVEPDPRWQSAIREAVQQFMETSDRMVEEYEQATEGLIETEPYLGDLEILL